MRWLSVYVGQLLRLNRADPVSAELRRIRPYYKGTRLLTAVGFAFILMAFILPFCVLFIDVQTFAIILLIYTVAFVLASLLGMAMQNLDNSSRYGTDILKILYTGDGSVQITLNIRATNQDYRSRGNESLSMGSLGQFGLGLGILDDLKTPRLRIATRRG
jgi:hypothetical protein